MLMYMKKHDEQSSIPVYVTVGALEVGAGTSGPERSEGGT